MGAGKGAGKGIVILIGIGANLHSQRAGPPLATCEAALAAMTEAGLAVGRRSRWYRSAPVPRSSQPWFVNGVVEVRSHLSPANALAVLHRIEGEFGRVRGAAGASQAGAARSLDLDLLAYGALVTSTADGPVVPHPRLHERAFVLLPLAEVAPQWRHPVSGQSVAELIAALAPGQIAEPLEEAPGP